MKIICAWCDDVLERGTDTHDRPSHGICDVCFEKMLIESGISWETYVKFCKEKGIEPQTGQGEKSTCGMSDVQRLED